jgi:hypothetical protein
MSADTAVDSILHDMERQPLAERLRSYVAKAQAPHKRMPDCVRSLPVPNLRNMIAAGTLTICEPLS